MPEAKVGGRCPPHAQPRPVGSWGALSCPSPSPSRREGGRRGPCRGVLTGQVSPLQFAAILDRLSHGWAPPYSPDPAQPKAVPGGNPASESQRHRSSEPHGDRVVGRPFSALSARKATSSFRETAHLGRSPGAQTAGLPGPGRRWQTALDGAASPQTLPQARGVPGSRPAPRPSAHVCGTPAGSAASSHPLVIRKPLDARAGLGFSQSGRVQQPPGPQAGSPRKGREWAVVILWPQRLSQQRRRK